MGDIKIAYIKKQFRTIAENADKVENGGNNNKILDGNEFQYLDKTQHLQVLQIKTLKKWVWLLRNKVQLRNRKQLNNKKRLKFFGIPYCDLTLF